MTNEFSPDVYRNYNLDLRHLTDSELREHFQKYPHERRIYGTSTTVETLSMRWLRGNGVEVGAGAKPTPLLGDARVQMCDCDGTLVFGGIGLTFSVQSMIQSSPAKTLDDTSMRIAF